MNRTPLYEGRNKLIYSLSFVICIFLQFNILKDWGIPWVLALEDAVFCNVLLALACWLLLNTLQYYQPSKSRYVFLLGWCLAITGLWAGVVHFLLPLVLNFDDYYTSLFRKSMTIRFDFAFLVSGCVALMSLLWYNNAEQQEKEKRRVATEKAVREAELYNLRQQLQPHFLFNSLNSISALAGSRPDEARKMIHQLSDFLRGTIRREDDSWVRLEDEMTHLGLYLDIEKVRFGHRLTTTVSLDSECHMSMVPPMILQPLVENAIKFGLYDTTGIINISILANCVNNELHVTVENPFDPETSTGKSGTGFGLSSLQRRLYLLFARNDLLTTSIVENRFRSELKIPQHDQGNIG
ncbi:MAG TPA: histidine kinase [Flavitalea sp.]|nr:histidine kinase [Flavitalea sp.]